ncbi:hypothetical protein C5167_039794 [Papaver somniferum]|uniref:Uncharacterized protein n=1 Tax=Papaver somniferum TaxID=3469 RepID=A0A4Y7IHE2_PAPSO|nr:hypothetical protein C5167_039794 [Papaver somniferum]
MLKPLLRALNLTKSLLIYLHEGLRKKVMDVVIIVLLVVASLAHLGEIQLQDEAHERNLNIVYRENFIYQLAVVLQIVFENRLHGETISYAVTFNYKHGACAAPRNPFVGRAALGLSFLKFICKLNPKAKVLLNG